MEKNDKLLSLGMGLFKASQMINQSIINNKLTLNKKLDEKSKTNNKSLHNDVVYINKTDAILKSNIAFKEFKENPGLSNLRNAYAEIIKDKIAEIKENELSMEKAKDKDSDEIISLKEKNIKCINKLKTYKKEIKEQYNKVRIEIIKDNIVNADEEIKKMLENYGIKSYVENDLFKYSPQDDLTYDLTLRLNKNSGDEFNFHSMLGDFGKQKMKFARLETQLLITTTTTVFEQMYTTNRLISENYDLDSFEDDLVYESGYFEYYDKTKQKNIKFLVSRIFNKTEVMNPYKSGEYHCGMLDDKEIYPKKLIFSSSSGKISIRSQGGEGIFKKKNYSWQGVTPNIKKFIISDNSFAMSEKFMLLEN